MKQLIKTLFAVMFGVIQGIVLYDKFKYDKQPNNFTIFISLMIGVWLILIAVEDKNKKDV